MIRFLPALLLAAPAAAQTLDGHWLNIGDPYGFVVPHFERLTLAGGRFESRTWTMPFDAALCARPEAPAACTPPVATGAGVWTLDLGRFAVAAVTGAGNPYLDPRDAGLWPHFALAGGDWAFTGGGRRFVLTRPAAIEGEAVDLERPWLRVDADVPELLFHYLLAIERSLARSFCAVLALHEDEAEWAGFLADLRVHAPVAAGIAAHTWAPARDRAAAERFAHLRSGQPLGPGAAGAADIPAAARRAWLEVQARAGGEAPEAPPGRVWLDALAWAVPAKVAGRVRACEAYFFVY